MENQSIHPRVVNGITVHGKVNTMKQKNPDSIRRAIAGITGHLENHPHDSMASARLAILNKML